MGDPEGRGRFRPAPETYQERGREQRQKDRELGVQPHEESQRKPSPHPGAQALLDRLPQPERGPGNDERTRRLRKHEPAVRHEGNGQADGRPGEERRAPPGERFRQIENRHGRQRGDQAHEHDDAAIARRGVGGKHHDRQARRVNRVDRAVLTATQEVGPQVAAEKLAVLAALVVVLDPQVAVGEQALGNDQIVRLVAARPDHTRRVHAEKQVENKARDEHRLSTGHLRLGGDQGDQTRTNRHGARQRHAGNDPADRTREHQQQRHAVWQPGQVRHDPQPQQCTAVLLSRRPAATDQPCGSQTASARARITPIATSHRSRVNGANSATRSGP